VVVIASKDSFAGCAKLIAQVQKNSSAARAPFIFIQLLKEQNQIQTASRQPDSFLSSALYASLWMPGSAAKQEALVCESPIMLKVAAKMAKST
jgi:hypothetical protein